MKFDPIALLAKAGEGRAASTYASGQVIFAQGDPADAVFYVQTGRVKLTIVSGQGKEAVVVLQAEEFERLTERARQPRSLVKFFGESPLAKVKLNLERRSDYGRDIDL